MGVRHELKVLFEKLTQTHVYRDLPRGTNLFHDLRGWLPNLRVETVFDVGANVGQSAQKYLIEFPDSQIYCFEPVEENFLKLQESLRGQEKAQSFKLALSSAKGTGHIAPGGSSQMFFLLRDVPGTPSQSSVCLEEIPLETLDGFCRDRRIGRMSFLKIDTEGNDLEVLKGAEELLSLQNIDVVEVEAGMNGKNKRHVPFGDFTVFLEARNYALFGVYDQAHEWPAREPQLRRSNLVFISERTIHGNTGR
jgi:FkbM family methyltransferase